MGQPTYPDGYHQFSMNPDLPHQNLTVDHLILGLCPIGDLSGLYCGCSRLEVTQKVTRTSRLIPLCARLEMRARDNRAL